MKEPTPEDARKCLEIRKRGKRGGYTHPAENKFCEKMFNKYPEWYKITCDEVFNDTVPVGSNVRKKNGETIYLNEGEY